jgi:Cdc6-like AAA superfamily ATPase
MGAVVEATRQSEHGSIGTGEAYDAYRMFCKRAELRPLTRRAFGDLISELDIYSLLRSRVLSRGRYGRTREIILDLPQELTDRLYGQILSNFEIHDQFDRKECAGKGRSGTEQIA